MKNIELFNLAVGEILGECYSTFPVPTDITRGTIGASVEAHCPDNDPTILDMRKIEYEISGHAISWLAKAGYIWVSEGNESSKMYKATLSPKGLEILNAVPESIKTGSIGSNLAKGAKEIGVGVFQTLVTQALSQGMNFNANTPAA